MCTLKKKEFDFAKELRPVDICILAAPADDTLIKLIPFMSSKSLVFPQTRIKSKRALQLIKKLGIPLGRAFSCFIDDFTEVMTLIKKKQIVTDPLITDRISLADVPHVYNKFFEKDHRIKTLIFNNNFS